MVGEALTAVGVNISSEVVMKTILPFVENSIQTYKDKNFSKDKVKQLFEKYLKVTYIKCSSIRTLVFSQVELPLEKIYQSIDIEPIRYNQTTHIESTSGSFFNEIIHNDLKNNLILIDSAGMGKSTFCKYLILKILQNKLYNRIPIFIELNKIPKGESLETYIVKDLSTYSSEFNKVFLFKLIEKGFFTFIFDGFDELSQNMSRTIGPEITILSQTYRDNIFILTSRNSEYIPVLYNSTSYHFKPFLQKDIEELILKYDQFTPKKIGEKLINEKSFINLDFTLFDTPLMVNLLYRVYSFNNNIESDIISFYNEMFHALYKGHDITKDGFIRKQESNLGYEKFLSLFNTFCFISLYYYETSFDDRSHLIEQLRKAKKLSSIQIDNIENFFNDLLYNVPFMKKDGLEYMFMHKTIQEFFAAQFLNTNANNTDYINKIFDSNKMNSFKKSFEFLYEINSSLYIKEIGSRFLNEYINFFENKTSYKNNKLNTLMFFDLIDTLEISELMIIHDKTETMYRNDLVFSVHTEDSHYFDIGLKLKENKYFYNPISFWNSIHDDSTNQNYTVERDIAKKLHQKIISKIDQNKFYKFQSDKIYSLLNETPELLEIVYNFAMRNKFDNYFVLDYNKSQQVLMEQEAKLDLL